MILGDDCCLYEVGRENAVSLNICGELQKQDYLTDTGDFTARALCIDRENFNLNTTFVFLPEFSYTHEHEESVRNKIYRIITECQSNVDS